MLANNCVFRSADRMSPNVRKSPPLPIPAMMEVAEDPFGCFGSSDDEDNGDGRHDQPSVSDPAGTEGGDGNVRGERRTLLVDKSGSSRKRDEDCGVLSFHKGTESALLAHVRNAVSGLPTQSSDDGGQEGEARTREGWEGTASDVASAAVLEAVDDFCRNRHWMMHVGPEKGEIICDTLRRSAEVHAAAVLAASKASTSPPVGTGRTPFICVELGTYCGYAAVLLGRCLKAATMAEFLGENTCPLEFHVYTVEVNPDYASIAREIIHLARLDDFVSVIDIPLDVNVIDTEDAAASAVSDVVWNHEAELRQQLRRETEPGRSGGDEAAVLCSNLPKIDFLFIDHDKDLYLSDLQRLEREGLVRTGTTVVADNVIFARIEDYLSYVKKLAEDGIVETETIIARMEYADEDEDEDELLQDGTSSDIFCDGVEVTKYRASPITGNESWLVRSAPRFATMKLRGEENRSIIGGNRPRPQTTGSVLKIVPY